MMTLKSTMGAPLSAAEETRIAFAWERLRSHMDTLQPMPDPVIMCEEIAELIGKCHEMRAVISECWHAANRRAFPATRVANKRTEISKVVADLYALGLTNEDILQELGLK